MIKGGKGGGKTKSGLKFEGRIDLRLLFKKLKGYTIKDNGLFFKGNLVAKLFKKHELYKHFLPEYSIKWETKISKKLLPDETVFILADKTLFIIEMKFQEVAGSVDEKLQTCDFKRKQYTKLVSEAGIKVEYLYVLNNWFSKKEYADVLNYIQSVGCHYFFEELPLNFLGLPEPE